MSNRRTFLKSAGMGAPAAMLANPGLLAQAGALLKGMITTDAAVSHTANTAVLWPRS
jgi:hypothetical protein